MRGDDDYPPNEMEVDGKLAGIHTDVVRAVEMIQRHEKRYLSFCQVVGTAVFCLESGQVDSIFVEAEAMFIKRVGSTH